MFLLLLRGRVCCFPTPVIPCVNERSLGVFFSFLARRLARILAWEDGFCNFAAAAAPAACGQEVAAAAAYAGDCEAAAAAAAAQEAAKHQPQPPGLQPELFFKMSHDIYNYGEG